MRYRSKPTEVEAQQWTGMLNGDYETDGKLIVAWVNGNGGEARYTFTPPEQGETFSEHRIAVRTINGWAYAKPGHYIVRSAVDFYPCDPDTFSIRWEPVVASSGEAPE